MNGEQVDRLVEELSKTRTSFDTAIKSFKWNRVHTIILYCLIVMVFILGGLGVAFYFDEKRESCQEHNDMRRETAIAEKQNAVFIGVALAEVSGATQDTFLRYLDAYESQGSAGPQLREC